MTVKGVLGERLGIEESAPTLWNTQVCGVGSAYRGLTGD